MFGGTPHSFVTGLSRQPQESQEINYLLALVSHSEVRCYSVHIGFYILFHFTKVMALLCM